MAEIDLIKLNFNPESLFLLNIILGIIMFGIALDLKVSDFRAIMSFPRSAFIGLFSQFFFLPALTLLLIFLFEPYPSMALGMMMVAACPGGNMSNFFTYVARGNTALSVSMSAISTACAVFMTPFNFAFWSGFYPPAANMLTNISLNPWDMAIAVFLLLGLPLALGLWVAHRFSEFANRTKKPMKFASIAFFTLFVLAAWAVNFDNFLKYVHLVVFVVLIHNGMALALGFFSARALGLEEKDQRAVAIEVGIQNSGLGLMLIFNFFGGLGGMMLVAAWWGIWHIVSGLSLAFYWGRGAPVEAGAILPDES